MRIVAELALCFLILGVLLLLDVLAWGGFVSRWCERTVVLQGVVGVVSLMGARRLNEALVTLIPQRK